MPYAVQCMEIWGSNHAVDQTVTVPGIDGYVVSRPYQDDVAGGDVHYISVCGGGKIARFAVADVAGHGDAVGEIAAAFRAQMRRHINTVDQTRFVRALNEAFAELATAGRFATAVLATYFAPARHLVTCNAGHPMPLWYRARTNSWQRLEHTSPDCLERTSNLPLGIIDPTEFHQFAVPLEIDDLVLIYTDALIEAVSPDGKPLTDAGLLGIIAGLDATQPAEFCQALADAVDAYRGHVPPQDDMTILLLHHTAASAPRQSVGQMAKVLGKMLGLLPV